MVFTDPPYNVRIDALRRIKQMADAVLQALSPVFDQMYSTVWAAFDSAGANRARLLERRAGQRPYRPRPPESLREGRHPAPGFIVLRDVRVHQDFQHARFLLNSDKYRVVRLFNSF